MSQAGRRIEVIVEDSNAKDKMNELVDKMEHVKVGDHTNNNGTTEDDPATSNGAVTELDHKVVKHPLQNAWTLWFYKKAVGRDWSDCHRPIITVSTVEDFWSLYNHIEVASKLPLGTDYSFFKEGIFPDWEDKRNAKGGRWMINLDKRQRADFLDTYWLEILFFLIGEHADQYAFQVNGAAVNVRPKGDRLGVWLADAAQPDSILRIGKMVKGLLGMDPGEKIGFTVHEDEQSGNNSSKRKQRHYV